jgi:hypothetical protein
LLTEAGDQRVRLRRLDAKLPAKSLCHSKKASGFWKTVIEPFNLGQPRVNERAHAERGVGAGLEQGCGGQLAPAFERRGARAVEAALTLAERIAVNAPLSVQASKRIALGIEAGDRPDENRRWGHSEAEWQGLMSSEDAKEGPLAFAEKRAPVWKSR